MLTDTKQTKAARAWHTLTHTHTNRNLPGIGKLHTCRKRLHRGTRWFFIPAGMNLVAEFGDRDLVPWLTTHSTNPDDALRVLRSDGAVLFRQGD